MKNLFQASKQALHMALLHKQALYTKAELKINRDGKEERKGVTWPSREHKSKTLQVNLLHVMWSHMFTNWTGPLPS